MIYHNFINVVRAANETFEKVSSFGLLANMILYLILEYNMDSATGAIVLFQWSAISNLITIIGAFLSDSYLGRFRVIAYGSISSLLVRKSIFSISLFQRVQLNISVAMFTLKKNSCHFNEIKFTPLRKYLSFCVIKDIFILIDCTLVVLGSIHHDLHCSLYLLPCLLGLDVRVTTLLLPKNYQCHYIHSHRSLIDLHYSNLKHILVCVKNFIV